MKLSDLVAEREALHEEIKVTKATHAWWDKEIRRVERIIKRLEKANFSPERDIKLEIARSQRQHLCARLEIEKATVDSIEQKVFLFLAKEKAFFENVQKEK